ncbi:MAG: acetyl-CoA carboxylase biotin carboxyl carrier protein [Nitrospirae bacterium]|nr:acetyl-CoA carboxylase biotin carboxyl carrier protein [Nitrospirota bacterium]
MSGDLRADIPQLVELLKRHSLAELEWECKGFRIRLRREGSPGPTVVSMDSATTATEIQPEPRTLTASNDTSGKVTITSPIVGTFYRSPSPDADAYVEEGDFVKKGQVLCIVEAMKLMNEIESEMDGRIVKILAESTKPVEYGQPLFLIEPESAA